MRASFFNRYDSINDSSSEPISVNIVGPLLLHADPVDPLHASSKRYVDGVFTGGLDASSITSEILSTDFMPEFTGDATASQGSNIFTLAATGVAPDNYKKVTVNAKGLVTSATQLSLEDIPALTWNKITSGKPVSILGYGITDAIRSTGDSLVGTIRVQTPPGTDLHAVTRQYVELRLQDIGTNEPVGTILEKSTSVTPTNFLRCNGGLVDKTTYSALYSVIGDKYSNIIEMGAGRPWESGFSWLNTTADVTSWTAGVSVPVVTSRTTLVATKNNVYILGNYVPSNSASATIYRGVISEDGTVTSWSVAGSIPYAAYWTMTCIAKNRLYFIGGCTNGTSSVYNLVRSCAIFEDGTLDTVWRAETGVPVNVYGGKALFFRNRIYVVAHAASGAIYSASIDSNGVLGSWSIVGTLNVAVYLASVTVIKNKLYILGGLSGGTPYSTIQVATILDDGNLSAFTTVGNLPVTLYTGTHVNTKNEIYLIGGIAAGAYHSNVYKASINVDGTLGSWTSIASLPSNQANNMAFFTKNKLYLVGNSSNGGTSAAATVYYATMTGSGGVNDYTSMNDGTYTPIGTIYNSELRPGSGKPWEQQRSLNSLQSTPITNWSNAGNIPVAKHACMAIATKNRVYLMGGSTGTISSAVHTAPINSDGTLGAWVATTSLPAVSYISQALVTKNRVYTLGGSNGSIVASIYSAPINADGTLGSWVSSGSLPTPLTYACSFITKDKIYLLGGSNGSILNTIYVATIDNLGVIGNWLQAGTLPTTIYSAQVAVTKNRVYLIGGNTTGSGSATASVLTAPINADGTLGSWDTGPSMPGPLQASSVFVTASRVYMFGGLTASTSTTATNVVYSAPVDADGILGAWGTDTSILVNTSFSSVIATSTKVYMFGGHNGSGVFATIQAGDITGGVNDYTSTYDGTYNPIDVNYNSELRPGSGQPWKQQAQFNNTQSSDIVDWTLTGSIPAAMTKAQAIVTKNRVYMVGGVNSADNGVTTTYTAPVNTDGTLGTWTTGPALPGALAATQAVVTKNRVYLLGGWNNTSIVATVYTAQINTDGTLGAWTTGASLPIGIDWAQVAITKNHVYLMGGITGASTHISSVYVSSINADGTLGTWTAGPSLPGVLAASQVVVTNSRIYLLGGTTGSGVYTSAIYSALINNDGTLSNWSTSGNLPTTLAATQVVVTENKVYLIGGGNGTGVKSTVYTAPINTDGTLGIFTLSSPLPVGSNWGQVIVTNGRVHLISGFNTSGVAVATIHSATFEGGSNDYTSMYDGSYSHIVSDYNPQLRPGSGKPWEQQYITNSIQTDELTGWVAGTALSVNRSGMAAVVTKNRVHLIGGYVGASAATSAVLTAPINADGTVGTWTTGTSLPSNLGFTQAIVTKNRVYTLGGYIGSSTATSAVYTAPINTDGTLGAWGSGPSLPVEVQYSKAIVTKNRVYLIGSGADDSASSSVYTALINEDGTLGNWTTASDLPVALGGTQAIITKDRVYLLGGSDSSGAAVSTVYTAPINIDGTIGTWTTDTPLPTILKGAQVLVTRNRVYLLGGKSGGSSVSTVYTAPINIDGTLGAWTTSSNLLTPRSWAALFATSSRVYYIGGHSASDTMTNEVYSVSFAGGSNDYSGYYDGSYVAVIDQPKFRLPDLSTYETHESNFYIRY